MQASWAYNRQSFGFEAHGYGGGRLYFQTWSTYCPFIQFSMGLRSGAADVRKLETWIILVDLTVPYYTKSNMVIEIITAISF